MAATTVLEEAMEVVEVANKAARDEAVGGAKAETKTTTLLVQDEAGTASSSDGAGAGAIVGIIVAVIVVGCGVAGAVYVAK